MMIKLIVISENTGISKEIITRIKNHVFIEEHLLNGRIERFFADADMVQAWQRLIDNKFIYSDLLLLQHEYAESFIMNGTKIGWREAHELVTNFYDWHASVGGF